MVGRVWAVAGEGAAKAAAKGGRGGDGEGEEGGGGDESAGSSGRHGGYLGGVGWSASSKVGVWPSFGASASQGRPRG